MVRIMAKTCGLRFFSVSATDGSGGEGLLSPYVGDGEYRLRELFRTARAIGPSLIFFDEMESLFAKRELGESQTSGVQERLLATLLNEMDGVGAQGEGVRQDATQVVVVGATNRPDKLDAALLRPGRFDHLVYVPPPDAAARRAILEVQWRRTPVDERLRHDEALMQKFIDKTVGYSGADIVGICQHAGMLAMDRLCGSRNTKSVDEQDYVVV